MYGLKLEETVEIPDGVKAEVNGNEIIIEGPNGRLTKTLQHYKVRFEKQGNAIKVIADKPRKREKSMVGTFTARIKNMIRGVTAGFEYKMKIVYSHFPMRATVKGDQVVIENFLGERYPRFASIIGETKIEVKGDILTLKGNNKEHIGLTAGNIEKATLIKGYDPRVFQDGIYLISKGEKSV
jgi:large subunit ribosomal protein L6